MSGTDEKMQYVAVSSRVRLARNLAGLPFPRATRAADAEEVVRSVGKALGRAGSFTLRRMNAVAPVEAAALIEKHLISPDLARTPAGAAFVSADESLCVMVNEEDHVREQSFVRGFGLRAAYGKLDKLDDALGRSLEFAYDGELGYLTACPTNLGTGLRASVMLFLPALTGAGAMGEIIREVSRLGLTVRGARGEGSTAEGYLYQISNEVTLGAAESKILKSVADAAQKICEAEMRTREIACERAPLETRDRCLRAYGLLTNCALMGSDEFTRLMADVKTGVSLGIMKAADFGALDELGIRVRPACLELAAGKPLTEAERDGYRAELAGKELRKLIAF